MVITFAKRLGAPLAMALLVLGLTSCDPIKKPDADVGLSVSGGDIRLVSCQALSVQRILVESRDFSKPNSPSLTILDAQGAAPLAVAEPFGPGLLPQGMRASVEDNRHLAPGLTVSLLIVVSGDGANVRTDFVMPSDGLTDGSWLRPDGTVRATPCG